MTSLQPAAQSKATYQVAAEQQGICGVFSGLEFGPIDTVNDRVFAGEPDSPALQTLVAIDGRPLFAGLTRDRARVFFLAGKQIADLDRRVTAFSSLRYFSQLVPPMMLLRHVFREHCWLPDGRQAALVIDDPLLQERYGFLNYARLLDLMDRHGFHTSIAFIPRNRFRTSPSVARLFRERPDRYSLCVHGNDHTAGELGTSDVAPLNALLQAAVQRMDVHQQTSAIPYDRVMVFPQGIFSETAMRLLKANNFSAAVNSHPNPRAGTTHLRLADYVQPAITGYGGFPLYLRKYVRELTTYDAASNLFFGQPVLLVEHHAVFKDADCVTAAVSRINSLAPHIQWCNLQAAIEHSFLRRHTGDGAFEVLTYAGCASVKSMSPHVSRCSVVKHDDGNIPLQSALLDDVPLADWRTEDGRLTFSFDLAHGVSRPWSLQFRNDFALSSSPLGPTEALRIVLRRRASEMRDNYLSKSPTLLSLADRLYRRFIV